MKIFFDGGCRPNPGAMEIAVVAQGQAHILRDIGQGSSFDAEWLALIEAAKLARAGGASDAVLLGDAIAIINQANAMVPCRGAGIAYRAQLVALMPPGVRLRIRYIKRTQNLAGIALKRLHDRG